MNFEHSENAMSWISRVEGFMEEHVHPNEQLWHEQMAAATDRWQPPPIIEALEQQARSQALWNLFLPHSSRGAGLTNLEYAPLAEIMGRVHWASEVFNCSAPDSGNMEVLDRFGSPEQKAQWLEPLLQGEIRSAFCMTEPDVASSDATNIRTRIHRDGDHYVINGRKWWSSGANGSRCTLLILMGQTDPDNSNPHRRQSQILIPKDTPGVRIKRHLNVFGFDDAPGGHAEIEFNHARVPVQNLLLGEGRGFEIAQGRLGPGRIHHCMRMIGQAEKVLKMMCVRSLERNAFGRLLADQGVTRERIAQSRVLIDQARLLVLHAADRMDRVGNKVARADIAAIKVATPAMLCQVVDWAIQLFGAAGICDDFGLSYAYARARAMRLIDGPDEVHRNQLASLELGKHRPSRA